MLLTPRSYALAQVPDRGASTTPAFFVSGPSVREEKRTVCSATRMLLVHQTGSVKVGEVIRYTFTYTPSTDRILPTPSHLYVRFKNTSPIPLRAAYLHGPYNIHVSAYPSTFDPNTKFETAKRDGIPEFQPNLKAGGSWSARLVVPEDIRETGDANHISPSRSKAAGSATWIIEVASQILFSHSASVGFELLIARDERSLDLGYAIVTGNTHGSPGKVRDHQQGTHQGARVKGVYSKAVKLTVDDTDSLWNKPPLQSRSGEKGESGKRSSDERRSMSSEETRNRDQRKIHLVVVTHGLHSNTGADMLFLKESIDAAAKQAKESVRARKRELRQPATESGTVNRTGDIQNDVEESSKAPVAPYTTYANEDINGIDGDEDVIVKGFRGNSVRTERGIQFLGKRLAKHILELTYPDQPFLPVKKSMSKKLSDKFSQSKDQERQMIPSHKGSSVHQERSNDGQRAYRYTSISFIGHSLGGLVQTYAIAYIKKHSPDFFDQIRPVNFITLATPFLGLSNENPMYIKFALDFGVVGRTGQDLGLTWRAPTIAKSGWTAMVGGFSGNGPDKDQTKEDPGAKPLLRILPTGPAHQVLRLFRNRTVYSNVVNDGIVPLRTSCLLFLDWRGLGKVEKARRENGLVGTVAEWGWGELTGQSTSPHPSKPDYSRPESPGSGVSTPRLGGDSSAVPQPEADATNEDDHLQSSQNSTTEPAPNQFLSQQSQDDQDAVGQDNGSSKSPTSSSFQGSNPFSGLLSFLRPSAEHTAKDNKMFKRSQTVKINLEESQTHEQSIEAQTEQGPRNPKRPKATKGDSLHNDPHNLLAPPKTTIFESAGDVLNPPVPPTSWIIDPSNRARTIFHDRVYHPEDIPPPRPKRNNRFGRSFSSETSSSSIKTTESNDDGEGVRVEEKIARAYHKDLSWRKVLVKLEPDAHNNIVVRRMFANAYGWPVVKHLCDTHFADTWSAATRDEHEPARDRAKEAGETPAEDGQEVHDQCKRRSPSRSSVEMREVADELMPLPSSRDGEGEQSGSFGKPKRADTDLWNDQYFDCTSDDDTDDDDRNLIQRLLSPIPSSRHRKSSPEQRQKNSEEREQSGTSDKEFFSFRAASPSSSSPVEMHRGLTPSMPSHASSTSASPRDADSLQSMNVHPQPSRAPESTQIVGSTSELGLRKSLEERMHTPTKQDTSEQDRALSENTSGESSQSQPVRQGSGEIEQVVKSSYSPVDREQREDGKKDGED